MATLNDDQKRAASHDGGHAIVLAGPGTGKTSTLAARYAFLVSKGISPENVFVVTFTQKAADELRKRIGAKAGGRAWVGTFHGHCLRLLKRFSEQAGLPRNFRVADPSEQARVLREIEVEWNQEDGDLLDMFARWKDRLVTPEMAVAEVRGKSGLAERFAAEHYGRYQERMIATGRLDFSDLVTRAMGLLSSPGPARDWVAENLPYALVDEFQDVNRVQVELLKAMAAAGSSVWAVGDDDQALYGWRGSSVFYTLRFHDYFPPSAKYALGVNYRCDPAVLKVASTLIDRNKHRVRKRLIARRAHASANVVRVTSLESEAAEADWIASRVAAFVGKGAKPSDIGVLVRTGSLAPHIQKALEDRELPVSLAGAQSFWDGPEMTAVLDLLDAIAMGDGAAARRYRGGADFVTTHQGFPPGRAGPAIYEFLASRPPANASAERVAAWADGVRTASAMAAEHASAEEFRSHVAAMSSRSSASSSDGVSLTTIHSAKGLEYRHAFIAGCEAGVMPHRKSQNVEEERRLLYVALTRSKGAVDITFCRSRAGRRQKPSPFLTEMDAAGSDCLRWNGRRESDESAAPALAAAPAKREPASASADGMPRVYRRKDGSRTMIPPGEE